MEISLAIKYIYPNIIRETDFNVLDDNQWDWPYIKWYNTSFKQPTQAELETAWVEVQALQQAELDKQAKKEAIDKIATLSDQLNLLASVLDTITSETPDQAIIDNAKAKFNLIQTILNN